MNGKGRQIRELWGAVYELQERSDALQERAERKLHVERIEHEGGYVDMLYEAAGLEPDDSLLEWIDGISEMTSDLMGKLTHVLDNLVFTEDGLFTFPDGETWDCGTQLFPQFDVEAAADSSGLQPGRVVQSGETLGNAGPGGPLTATEAVRRLDNLPRISFHAEPVVRALTATEALGLASQYVPQIERRSLQDPCL